MPHLLHGSTDVCSPDLYWLTVDLCFTLEETIKHSLGLITLAYKSTCHISRPPKLELKSGFWCPATSIHFCTRIVSRALLLASFSGLKNSTYRRVYTVFSVSSPRSLLLWSGISGDCGQLTLSMNIRYWHQLGDGAALENWLSQHRNGSGNCFLGNYFLGLSGNPIWLQCWESALRPMVITMVTSCL